MEEKIEEFKKKVKEDLSNIAKEKQKLSDMMKPLYNSIEDYASSQDYGSNKETHQKYLQDLEILRELIKKNTELSELETKIYETLFIIQQSEIQSSKVATNYIQQENGINPIK